MTGPAAPWPPGPSPPSPQAATSRPSSLPESLLASQCLWDESRRHEMVLALARAAGLAGSTVSEPFALDHAELSSASSARLRGYAPFVVRLAKSEGLDSEVLVAVVSFAGEDARLLTHEGTTLDHPWRDLATLLRAQREGAAAPGLAQLMARLRLPASRADAVRTALVTSAAPEDGGIDAFRLRARRDSLREVFRREGTGRWLLLTVLAHVAQLTALMLTWWQVGERAVALRAGGAGTFGWGGSLAAFVVLRLLSSWSAGRLAIHGGWLFRRHVMQGLLGLSAEPLRSEGIGQLLGRVIETSQIEALVLGGGLQALVAAFELVTGAVVLAVGTGDKGPLLAGVLLGWLLLSALLSRRLARSLRSWSSLRLSMTHDLVERMVGHRTLVAQQPPERRHLEEERQLHAYEHASRAFDRDATALAVLVPRGWLLVGTLAVLPVLRDSSVSASLIVTSLGGVLFVYGAFRRLAQAFPLLALAATAWRRATPLFAQMPASTRNEATECPRSAPEPAEAERPSAGAPLLTMKDVVFRYRGRADAAIKGCSLDIHGGDRVLWEGSSGGGKSTMGALLAGLVTPESGVLTLYGRPQASWGLSGWRARVGLVPQFHENHVFSSTLAFNLLMGRRWPPRPEDLREAEAVCAELDLGSLLARMPSGLEQQVGETGWQLSHGERSRIFIARSLLQELDVRIFDESFAALDPETLERVLSCVLHRAKTLVVIAHP